MDSMEDLMKKLVWIAWFLTVIGWFLSPIISLLVNKLFAYIEFDASTKLKELENDIIRKLKQTLGAVEEQTLLRAAEDNPSHSDLNILDSMKKDLKSALYEAEDILDLLDYRRIEKDLHHGDDDSRWVENQLGAACSFGRWIHVTLAAVMKRAQSMFRQGQLVIQGWRHSRQNFDLFSIRRAINNAGAGVLQCAQSWYKLLGQLLRSSVLQCAQQLGQLFRDAILCRPGVLLPVSINPTPQSRGSVLVSADPPCRPPKELMHEEVIEEGEKSEEIDEEGCQGEEEGETSEEKTEEENCEGEGGETSEEGIQEHDEEGKESEAMPIWVQKRLARSSLTTDDEEGKEREPTSLSILLQYCARSMLTWFAKACFYRDWPYGIVGIKSDKKDASAVESLVPITERISLKNRIKRIEDILDTSKKSDLLNDENSSSGTTKDNDKEISGQLKEIDVLYKSIEQKVFGREQNGAHISRMLREGPDINAPSSSTIIPYSVIGIYGITGSGKSTLAQYVCAYEKNAGHFYPVMFIHVGKTFSVGNIFRDMLELITHTRPPNDKGLKTLKTELEKILKGKCFLLVLDDLWVNDDNQKELDILLDMLRLSAAWSGSRVLVTAQKEDAAGALGAHLQLFPIPDLEEEVYLSLLMHHAGPFATDDDYGEYERIGRKITKRLRRSPIAAVTVGKRLQNKSISFWDRTAKLDVLNKTMGALWWSYQQLGVDIRRCFAYHSTFPKGYELTRDELVHIWIAQGFANTRSNATPEKLEDVGQRYCDELLTFSFLQGQRLGKTETITIHDLLHELAERVSGSESFRIELNGSPEDIPRGVHHLFIGTTNGVEIAEKLCAQVEVENLRTLIIKEALPELPRRDIDSEKLLERLFIRLTKLRVLIIKQNGYEDELSVPACIDRMKHLRYLGLHFANPLWVLILPSTFSKLYHIEIIDIPLYRASYPEDMSNLIYLRHITDFLYFPNIGRLKQLMHRIKLRGTLIIDALGIFGRKEIHFECSLIKNKHSTELKLGQLTERKEKQLTEQKVIFSRNVLVPDMQVWLLESNSPPKEVQQLHIENYTGSRYPSWMLSRRRYLEELKKEQLTERELIFSREVFGPDLDAKATIAPKQMHRLELARCSQVASIPEDSELFIGLRELSIYDCDWDRLPENMDRLLSLQTLQIWFCDNMKLLPNLPVQSLKKISITCCEVLSTTCKQEEHENWRKIQQIPEKEIN